MKILSAPILEPTSQNFRYRQALISEQMAEHQNIVGPIIRELREKKGLSQGELVAKLNIIGWDLSRGTLSKIEAQIRCVTDYEIPILAISVGIEPPELIRLALANRRRQNLAREKMWQFLRIHKK